MQFREIEIWIGYINVQTFHLAGGVEAEVSRAAREHHLRVPMQSKRIEMPVLEMPLEQRGGFECELQLLSVELNGDVAVHHVRVRPDISIQRQGRCGIWNSGGE